MSAPDVTALLALALAMGAAIAAAAILRARSLFTMTVSVAAMSALAAGSVLLLGGRDGAVALAVFGVALAPLFLLGAMLLSVRIVKSSSGRWVNIVALIAGLGAAYAIAPEVAASHPAENHISSIGLWLAMLVFVAVVGCVALLGYGERGVLQRLDKADR